MRRNRKVNPKDYIKIRIEQLKEERNKSEDRMTQMWIYKIISELQYVLQVMEKRNDGLS
jgi:hypothetical protein|tara:strand:+ start:5569 stop:5745 length:177 start_codon:yes stop_codon:yes gene_type:complete